VVKFGSEYAPWNLINEAERIKKSSATLQIRANGQKNPLVNVRLRRESIWFASNIDIIWVLVHPHVVDGHDRREGQVFEIDKPEVGRYPQIENDVLGIRKPSIRMDGIQKINKHAPSVPVELV
jgi:hypothetical protein